MSGLFCSILPSHTKAVQQWQADIFRQAYLDQLKKQTFRYKIIFPPISLYIKEEEKEKETGNDPLKIGISLVVNCLVE